jgi:hypothetical protein
VYLAEIEDLTSRPAIFGSWPVVPSRGRVLPHWSGYAVMRDRIQSAIHDPIRTVKSALSRPCSIGITVGRDAQWLRELHPSSVFSIFALDMSLALMTEWDATAGWRSAVGYQHPRRLQAKILSTPAREFHGEASKGSRRTANVLVVMARVVGGQSWPSVCQQKDVMKLRQVASLSMVIGCVVRQVTWAPKCTYLHMIFTRIEALR